MSSLVTLNSRWDVVTAGAVVGCGVVGGVFFAFSTFIMSGLGRLPARQGIAAMQSVNITAVRPAFMLGLFGTAILCAVSVIRVLTGRVDRHGSLVFAGALVFLLGAIGLTIAYNVPLNNRLAALSPDDPNSVAVWQDYLRNWTLANHVRTASCLAATVLLLLSLSGRQSEAPTASGVGAVLTDARGRNADDARLTAAATHRDWIATPGTAPVRQTAGTSSRVTSRSSGR